MRGPPLAHAPTRAYPRPIIIEAPFAFRTLLACYAGLQGIVMVLDPISDMKLTDFHPEATKRKEDWK